MAGSGATPPWERSVSAGSPGTIWIARNTIVATIQTRTRAPTIRFAIQIMVPLLPSGDRCLLERDPRGEGQRAGKVVKPLHGFLHGIALRAPGEAHEGRLLERLLLHLRIDLAALVGVKGRASLHEK